jgi:antitoxin component of MazEF toxin-antitoxin module
MKNTMLQQQITQVGHTPALLLPEDILEQLGLHVGDSLDISIIDGLLIASPSYEEEREQKIQAAIQKVFTNRKSAYQRLA